MLNQIRQSKRSAIGLGAALVAAFALGGIVFSSNSGDSNEERPTGETSHGGHEHGAADQYTCSMHPQVRSSEAGSCPICGMDLIAVETHDVSSDSAPNRLSLSEGAKTRARIRTTAVVKLGGSATLQRRLLGRVDYDETRQRRVTAWIAGRIDKLRIRSTGEKVRRGQVIATLYSPEVFSAHQDLLVAKKQVTELAKASPIARTGAEAALAASRDRLRLLGVPVGEVTRMEDAERPSEQVSIRSPFSGTVIKRLATEGNYVTTGSGLYEIADLSKLWIQLDAYESDLALLRSGQSVSLKIEALPNESFDGVVTFVDPVLDPQTRTTRVRIEVANKDRRLRPGMFAEAIVESSVAGSSEAEAPLVIPDTAPLFTGRRSLVYVEVPGEEIPTYEARVVRLGPKMGDLYPVMSGLSAGEQVVIHGAFTLDADLQIRGGLSMMSSPDDTEAPVAEPVQIPKAERAPLAAVVDEYLALQEALSESKLEEAKKRLASLGAKAKIIGPTLPRAFGETWRPIQSQLVSHTAHAAHMTTIAEVRTAFRDVSVTIEALLRRFGNPTTAAVHHAFCPMAFDGVGAAWVQRADEVENPYFGAPMYTCGSVNERIASGDHLRPAQVSDKQRSATPAGGHQH